MKAEISNLGLHRAQRLVGVYLQQGRMLVDRDWNELCEILRRLGRPVVSEAIGDGVPRHGGMLDLRPADSVLVLRSQGGLVAAAGVIGEMLPRTVDGAQFIYQNQLDLPAQVRAPARLAQPGGSTGAESTPPATAARRRASTRAAAAQGAAATATGNLQPLLPNLPDGRLLYVDIWDRVITAFESDAADLIDPALHGADTCFRKQRLVQIKAAAAADLLDPSDPRAHPCRPAFRPERIPAKGNGVFDASLAPATQGPDSCDPCAQQVTITRALTNYLFRLEVHSVGFDNNRAPNRLVLKWSKDNGARELRTGPSADPTDTTHSYEYFSDATERLLGMPSDDWAAEEFLRGVLDPADPTPISGALPRIREWDGWCELTRAAAGWNVARARYRGAALAGATVTPATTQAPRDTLNVKLDDTGVAFSLVLTGKTFLAGDYWLALVRARAEPQNRVRVVSPAPIGIEHHYCILAAASLDGGNVVFKNASPFDLRRLQHPSLTCLDASDVGYATDCPSGLFNVSHNTVKKALDQVCHIEAKHVAYGQQCHTSVYGQTAPANIRTVADALNLLCSVKAEQILFDRPCKTSIYSQPGAENVHTVADALGLLCTVSAEQIGFDIKSACKYLQAELKDDAKQNVAAALNALCGRPDQRPLPVIAQTSWQNDTPMPLGNLRNNGLSVLFSEDMNADSLTTDSFVVTWEVPLSLSSGRNKDFLFAEFLTPQIMVGRIEFKAKAATFRPRLVMTDDLFKAFLADVPKFLPPESLDFAGIRCRVRLIGRAIFAADRRPLDGHVPMLSVPGTGTGSSAHTSFDFNKPGVGHVSDFESWFYLIP
jgi:hypothetical protein